MKRTERQNVAPATPGRPMTTDKDSSQSPSTDRTTGKRWGRPPAPAPQGKRQRPRRATALRRLMSEVAVGELVARSSRAVQLTTDLEDLATVFANDRAPAVAVIDEAGELCGVVARAAVQHLAPAAVQDSACAPRVTGSTVADLMAPVSGSIEAETSLGLALTIMVFSELELVPVVRGIDNVFLGLLTLGDVARWLTESAGYLRRKPGP